MLKSALLIGLIASSQNSWAEGAGLSKQTISPQVSAVVPKVGYFPNSFPRDPLAVNNFLEHVLIGQIIEPLVESASSGQTVPCVAESWTISKDSKTILFRIRKNLRFSNGQRVAAKDVKYSIDRQRRSEISQSRSYLEIIEDINVVADDLVSITLKRPYIAFFKSLSRDHLGIVPYGWKFDPSSDEPIIGTGPYRAIRKGDTWRLKANSEHRLAKQIKIDEWEIVLFDPKSSNYDQLPLPDLIPYAQYDLAPKFDELAKRAATAFHKEPINHFIQFSAWWYPGGKSFTDEAFRLRAMAGVGKLLKLRQSALGHRPATGIIPEGITGHIPKSDPIQVDSRPSKTRYDVKVAVVQRDLPLLNVSSDVKQIEDEFGLRFIFEPVPVNNFAVLKESRPDVVGLAYAGGFHDPEGFLVVVSSVLGTDVASLFGALYPQYQRASQESDWAARATLYKEFNANLVRSGIVAPGWKPIVYQLTRGGIKEGTKGISYTTKLINFDR